MDDNAGTGTRRAGGRDLPPAPSRTVPDHQGSTSEVFDVIALTASLTMVAPPGGEGTDLVVTYEAVNVTDGPILVAHVPRDVRHQAHPNTAYCSLSLDRRRVNLLLGASAPPADWDPEFGVTAMFVEVPLNGSVEGEIRLAVPLQQWNGYYPPVQIGQTQLVEVRQVALQVDAIHYDAQTWMRPAWANNQYWKDHLAVGGPYSRHELMVNLVKPLPVAERNDAFPNHWP